MTTATYIATCQAADGQTVTRIIRLFGKGNEDDVRAMLEENGYTPCEIIRAPTSSTLAEITEAITTPYKIMYAQGK